MDIEGHGRAAEGSVLFSPVSLGPMRLPNRLIRAATYEGMADAEGRPQPELGRLYARLAEGGVGAVVTGFAFVSQDGRAMQPRQCGIECDARIEPWRRVLQTARAGGANTRFVLQIAHAGRQTRSEVTGLPAYGASARRCTYFRQRVRAMDERRVFDAARSFGDAAWRAREAGFDGVQVHAAHGYLIHQFLSPWTNRRRDRWGDPPAFLEEVLRSVRERCGSGFAVTVKLSAADDNDPGIRLAGTLATVRRIETRGADAVEVSYGSMEHALNIIRGDCPADLALKTNPIFRGMPAAVRWAWKTFRMRAYMRALIPFAEDYNLEAARAIRAQTSLPVVVVGGIRSGAHAQRMIAADGMAAVALCRPLICEPGLPRRLEADPSAQSACVNCNVCTVFCDSDRPVRCYRRRESANERE